MHLFDCHDGACWSGWRDNPDRQLEWLLELQDRLIEECEVSSNLVAYINGFSETARRIFEKFKFGDQIEKLDSSNRLYAIVQAMAGVDLHPDKISNIEMGYKGDPKTYDPAAALFPDEVIAFKGPTDVGTARVKDTDVPLSTLVDKLNDRFGTDFNKVDQLFFDQVSEAAMDNEKIVEAAKANGLANFATFFGKVLDDLLIQRMEGNDEIFARVMSDKEFRSTAQDHLAREVFERIRGEGGSNLRYGK